MKNEIIGLLKIILSEMGVTDVDPEVEVPGDPTHGDYSTNLALRLASNLQLTTHNPQLKTSLDIALQVAEKFKSQKAKVKGDEVDQNINQSDQTNAEKFTAYSVLQDIDHVEVVAPGFINIFLTEAKLSSQIARVLKEEESYGMSCQTSDLRPQTSAEKQNVIKSEVRKLKSESSSQIMVEYAHPNTHKAFHIGHLRNITTGESIIRLLEASGHKVIRSNYEGDVGMHIAKALYALMELSDFSDQLSAVRKLSVKQKVEFLGKAYAAGSTTFEADETAKQTIKDFNYLIYAAAQRFQQERGIEPGSTDYLSFVKGRKDEVDEVYALWKETRQWSLDYFDSIYKRVGSHFDRLYFESECLAGVDRAKEAVKKGILKESEGAVIFDGKPFGIDTRVFVNSLGLPTYEGKELALAPMELSDFGHLDRIIHVVGPEQASFFKVTFKVQELLGLQKDQQYHFIYGWVKLKHGKMSSRTGQVVLGEWLLDEAKKEIYSILQKSESKDTVVPRHSGLDPESIPSKTGSRLGGRDDKTHGYSPALMEEIAEKAAVAAVKYSFLRVAPENTIAFDLRESVNFEGDSGPYLQYTYARCKSVLRKAGNQMLDDRNSKLDFEARKLKVENQTSSLQPQDLTSSIKRLTSKDSVLNPEELAVSRLIFHFPEVVAAASESLAPNVLCSYLFKLAQTFNLFYSKHSILGNSLSSMDDGSKSEKSKILNAINYKPLTINQSANWRIVLTAATAQVLKNGLYLLGIETLEQM